ncbi:hypothetical protein LOC67_23320 [Stieleria sp. JC731]|uniref:hypothetical protein n=1 Tax=Pirellulaceae TaxID=2691357 RepID=UPI001E550480|nr:hypothetical protein [Stieleria sp. JC731]MCC9603490.1 hypothetical protein [Stieleria sp. JC731]
MAKKQATFSTDHMIQIHENGKHLGYLGGGYPQRQLIHVDHFPTRTDAEWFKFSELVLQLRKLNPGLRFTPKPARKNQRLYK